MLAPGTVCTGMNERDAAFSPDGRSFYFTVLEGQGGTIVRMEKSDNGWTAPEVASFSGTYSDVEPFVTPDGSKLYFSSNRPLDLADSTADYNIWVCENLDGQWTDPSPLGPPINTEKNEFFPTLTREGVLYLTAKYEQPREDIYRAEPTPDGFAIPVRLNDAINSPGGEFNALVSPDETMLFFTTWGRKDGHGGGDLYVSFREDGQWQPAINLGADVNSATIDYCPALTPDGTKLVFTSQRLVPTSEQMTYKNLLTMHNSPGNGKGDLYWIELQTVLNLKDHAE